MFTDHVSIGSSDYVGIIIGFLTVIVNPNITKIIN